MKSIAYANGVATSYTYDADRDWLTKVEVKKGSTTLASFAYSRDAVGRISSALGSYGNPAQGPGAMRPHAVLSAGTATFSYDANGNQLVKSVGGAATRSIAYDAENRPVSVTSGGATVTVIRA